MGLPIETALITIRGDFGMYVHNRRVDGVTDVNVAKGKDESPVTKLDCRISYRLHGFGVRATTRRLRFELADWSAERK